WLDAGFCETAYGHLAIDLTKHDVEGTQDSGDVRQHVPLAKEIHGLQMREPRGAQLAAVRLVGAVRNEIDAELTLGRFNGGIYFAGGDPVALGIKLEVMDQSFHRLLHRGALRWNDLAVGRGDRADLFLAEQQFHALTHDTDGLAHLFHTDQIAIIAVAILADRNVELEFVVALIWLRLAHVPCRARTTNHHARETKRPSVFQRDDADVDVTLLEDAVRGDQRV